MNLEIGNHSEAKKHSGLIAKWYKQEWDIPENITIERLERCTDAIPFQIVVLKDNEPIATGGIYHEVGLFREFPDYKVFQPWLALLYTLPEYRGLGVGSYICDFLDKEVVKSGYREYYLFTNTAENLYLKQNWEPIDRVIYREKPTVIMKKTLA
ncbi:GNAT family N-acetyltransferase [Leptospira sp. 'Mane']|uniref:GNAT family N-acetyltransferase n=1 Tax=Leptospira sp. 'Mane' TaxID=3387407 RepID=UPI00398AD3F5